MAKEVYVSKIECVPGSTKIVLSDGSLLVGLISVSSETYEDKGLILTPFTICGRLIKVEGE
jgi:hypothetical protein